MGKRQLRDSLQQLADRAIAAQKERAAAHEAYRMALERVYGRVTHLLRLVATVDEHKRLSRPWVQLPHDKPEEVERIVHDLQVEVERRLNEITAAIRSIEKEAAGKRQAAASIETNPPEEETT